MSEDLEREAAKDLEHEVTKQREAAENLGHRAAKRHEVTKHEDVPPYTASSRSSCFASFATFASSRSKLPHTPYPFRC
jgi:hypothetical protein